MFELIHQEFGLVATLIAFAACFVGAAAFAVGLYRALAARGPVLVRLGMPTASLLGVPTSLLCFAAVVGLVPIEGDFPSAAKKLVAGATGLSLALLGGTGVAYYHRSTWARPLAIAFWPSLGAGLAVQASWSPPQEAWFWPVVALELVLLTGFAAWYFYRRPSVVRHFTEREAREGMRRQPN